MGYAWGQSVLETKGANALLHKAQAILEMGSPTIFPSVSSEGFCPEAYFFMFYPIYFYFN